MPPPATPDPRLLGDFFVTGDHTLGELAEIYGLTIAPEDIAISLADYVADPYAARAEAGRHAAAAADRAGGAQGGRWPRRRRSACGSRRSWRRASRRRAGDGSRRSGAACSRGWGDGHSGRRRTGSGPTSLSMITASTPNTAAIRSGVNTVARRAFRDQPAAIHHHDAIGEARGEREIVHDREHGPAVMRGARQQLHHHELMARIERHGRLVGEQDRRLAGERPRERHARPLAAGERGHRARRRRPRWRWRRARARPRRGRRARAARTHRHADGGRAPPPRRPPSANGTHGPAADRRCGGRARARKCFAAGGRRPRCGPRPGSGPRARASAWSCRRRWARSARPARRLAASSVARSTISDPPSRDRRSLRSSACGGLTTALLRAGGARGRSWRGRTARRSAR